MTRIAADGRVSFALSVTDALPEDMLRERLLSIAGRSSLGHMDLVCVRNDTRDPGRLSAAASMASTLGLGIVVCSADPEGVRQAVGTVPGISMIVPADPDRLTEFWNLSSETGIPVAIPGRDVQELMDNAESALSRGAGVVLDPHVPSMKSCLETVTDLTRLRREHGILRDVPVMVRAWSGEYALALSSVAAMRGADILVLDDLDPEACEVLDTLLSDISR